MCSKFRTGTISKLAGYTYPTLHKGARWYVDFFAFDPARKEMRHKRYYIADYLKRDAKKRRAAEIIEVLTKQLMQGWNPWVTSDDARDFVLFEDCLNRYLEYVERMDRAKTRSCYRSRVKVLHEYIDSRVIPIQYVYQYDSSFCNDFLDWIFLDRECSPRTRNNYRSWLYGFAEFMVGRRFIKVNPVEHIRIMPEHEKYRKDLTPEMMTKDDHISAERRQTFLSRLHDAVLYTHPSRRT